MTVQDPNATPGAQENDYFDIYKFENLLSRLEASKTRQSRDKSIEDRRGTWASGLANMMTNF
tara:strand:- start:153 stop:338 length:186 start_codon:yes stop_codon:yes gene_type:complete